ncbi:YjbH domain-containing protein [Labilibaculum sp. DW002]|uniref:YjbH domain-containing protein n=1 Tax=Paralabilibaculum antarcticum TaxID=2912572 RepID=A0ABT5VQ43_9BACT|nr:YjbH domain-containing protein [Labilibaculum sp. DW002]MDE5417545.1 YjbH domain-containing protein [Labilibaculum sp. DW002]
MKHLIKLFLISLCLLTNFQVNAQGNLDDLSEKLCVIGFENVKVLAIDHQVLVSLENNVYSWDVEAISIALDCIAANVTENNNLTLYVLNHAIPQVQLQVSARNWEAFRKGELPKSKMKTVLHIESKIDSNYQLLEEQLFWNPNTNKVDLVIYPQMYLQNTGFHQIYETQINLNPVVEVDLWKGMQFTGQVIVPLVNDYGKEGDEVRPGFVTLNQNLRFGESYFGKLSVGNFNTNRYGAHASVFRPVLKNRVEVEANIGLTGASHFYQGRWMNEDINEFNWFVKSRYFHHEYGLELALSYGKYIYGDKGIRADVIRHFGRVSISFFAIYTGGESNGGFNFTIPLPTKKRKRKRSFRVMPANYFDWEYDAGTEFVKGQLYETKPNANRTEDIYNPIYLKSQLLTL